LIDQVEGEIYSIVKNKAFYEVYLVNINSAQIKYITKISIFNGGTPKINNGYIYYLKKPSTSKNQVRKLSRIKI